MLWKIRRYFTGTDFFLSYSRYDGSGYALKLANEITKNGYSCYMDQWGTEPGKEIPAEVYRKLKKASVFILIGSTGACSSANVGKEIRAYKQTKGVFVPINFGGIETAEWYTDIEGVALTNEPIDSLERSTITENVASRIFNSLHFKKQAARIRKSIIIALLLFVVIVSSSLFLLMKNVSAAAEINEKAVLIEKQTHSLDSLQDTMNYVQNEVEFLSRLRENLLHIEDSLKRRISNDGVVIDSVKGLFSNQFSAAQRMAEEIREATFSIPVIKNYCHQSPFDVGEGSFEVKEGELIFFIPSGSATLRPDRAEVLDEFIDDWRSSGNEPEIIVKTHFVGFLIDEESLNIVRLMGQTEKETSKKIAANWSNSVSHYLISKGIPANKIRKQSVTYNDSRSVIFGNKVSIYTR